MDLVEALSSFISETLIIYNLSLVEEKRGFLTGKRGEFSLSGAPPLSQVLIQHTGESQTDDRGGYLSKFLTPQVAVRGNIVFAVLDQIS